jgi:hypothetical protein
MESVRERNVRVLEACFAAIAAGDADRLVAHYTDDYELEFPYRSPDATYTVRGRDAVRVHLAQAFERVELALSLTALHPAADPDLIVAEYRAEGRLRASGAPYRNRYVGLWWFRDGRVCRTREYYDPVAAAAALAAAPGGDGATPGTLGRLRASGKESR